MTAEWETLQAARPDVGPPPSYDTFCKRYKSHWKFVLLMRKTSQHGQCKVCFDLHLLLRNPLEDWGVKIRAARDLREHLRQQYLDRSIYWSLRWSSCHDDSVLTIIIDSMGKFGTTDRPSKETEHLVRPKLVLTAALAHGWGTFMFACSESEHHGAAPWQHLCIACAFMPLLVGESARPGPLLRSGHPGAGEFFSLQSL